METKPQGKQMAYTIGQPQVSCRCTNYVDERRNFSKRTFVYHFDIIQVLLNLIMKHILLHINKKNVLVLVVTRFDSANIKGANKRHLFHNCSLSLSIICNKIIKTKVS